MPSIPWTLDSLKAFFTKPSYIPMSKTALVKKCQVPLKQKASFYLLLQELVNLGVLEIQKSKFVPILPKQSPLQVQGLLHMNPRGFGFVTPNPPSLLQEDIFIAKHLTSTAVDGDLVDVEILQNPVKDKGPEGRILSIAKRGRSHIAAIVRHVDPHQKGALLYSPLLGPAKLLQAHSALALKYGDRVIAKVTDWGGKDRNVLCEVQHLLGSILDASIDIAAAAEEFQIPSTFPKEVVKEASLFGKRVKAKDLQGRLDITKSECFTIDPKTAKDFDDALSLSVDNKGVYHLGVHIADVAFYVRPGSLLDQEAKLRSNSTYFPGSCLPMLPHELSNELCSLKPDVVRLTVSVFMSFDREGTLLHHRICRSYIQSAKRFTYEEAKEVLDGTLTSPHLPTLQKMVQLCQLLKKKRSERGSIDFALPEVVLHIDAAGEPTSYDIVEYDITHQLVEEFMLKANEVVAQALGAQGKDLLFRIHEQPKEETLEEFYALARSLGFPLPQAPTQQDLQKLFEQAKQTSLAEQLSIAFIRSMKLATYSKDNVGHFGLALEEYCHFTSPIRRYPDLVIQRILFGEQPEDSDLQIIASECSDKERLSFKAEQNVKTLKKLRLLKRWFQEDPHKIYHCQITKIKPFGLYFDLPPISVEGFLHISELEEDYFIYEPFRNSFLGKNTHIRFCIGDSLKIKIRNIDLALLEVQWQRALKQKEKPLYKKKKRRRR